MCYRLSPAQEWPQRSSRFRTIQDLPKDLWAALRQAEGEEDPPQGFRRPAVPTGASSSAARPRRAIVGQPNGLTELVVTRRTVQQSLQLNGPEIRYE
jgi:hypothetical protein